MESSHPSTNKVLVTPRSVTRGGHPSLKRLEQAGWQVVFCTPGKQPDLDELKQLLPGCAGYLAGVEPISDEVLAAAPDLKVISRNGVGVDNIDLAAAARRGIKICKAAGANARGVAELTVAHMLALARWISFSDQAIKQGGWERRKGVELLDKTLGLIGCGQIGQIVARLALALGMKVVAYDPQPAAGFAPSPDFRFASLEEAIITADFISLHCPGLADSRPVLDCAALARVKRGVFIINTARAGLIDPEALAAALADGRVAGAALDVFKTEPPGKDPLALSNRVIATPHIGAFTEESVDRAMEIAVARLLDELPAR
jgi:D-3-phosphoglycerate dehydrogenase / 2-oxoglutarate reductase